MSCNVPVIPEDPTYNGYILKPLVSKLLETCGRARANVKVLTNPRVSGFEHACGSLAAIVERYAYFDLWLFLPDGDGKDRSGQFARLESAHGRKLICCAAVEEVEAWLLAGHSGALPRPWNEVRSDISVKENVFLPFLSQFGEPREPGGGRTALMNRTLANLPGLLARCPELADLQRRLGDTLAGSQ